MLRLTGPCEKQSNVSPQLNMATASCGCSHVTQAVNVLICGHFHSVVISGGEVSLCCLNSCRVLSVSGWTETSCCACETSCCACQGPLCRPSYGPSQYQSGSSVPLQFLGRLGAGDCGLLLAATLAGLTGIQAGRVLLLQLLGLALRLARGPTAVVHRELLRGCRQLFA